MTYEQLVEWCGWFWDPVGHSCRCRLWEAGIPQEDDGRICPVLAVGSHPFVPEPIRGDPLGRDFVFLAANPGGRRPFDVREGNSSPWWNPTQNAPGVTDQRPSGNWCAVLETPEAFADAHIRGNREAANNQRLWLGYTDDFPMRMAVGIVAWLRREIPHPACAEVGDANWVKHSGDVALVNVLHCKSPEFPANASHVLRDSRRCGAHTWTLFKALRPLVVIGFGGDVRAWYHMHSEQSRPNVEDVTRIKWLEGDTTTFYWLTHPGHGQADLPGPEFERIFQR